MEERVGWTTTEPSASRQLRTHRSGGIPCNQGCRRPLFSARGIDRRLLSVHSAMELTTCGPSVLSRICIPQPHEANLPPMPRPEVHQARTLPVPDANQKTSASPGIKAPVFTQVTVITGMCVPLVT